MIKTISLTPAAISGGTMLSGGEFGGEQGIFHAEATSSMDQSGPKETTKPKWSVSTGPPTQVASSSTGDSSSGDASAGGGGCPPDCPDDFWESIINAFTSTFRSSGDQLKNKERDIAITQHVVDEAVRIADGTRDTSILVLGSIYPAARATNSIITWGSALSRAAASQSTNTVAYSTHFNHGVWRLTAQYSNGLFAPGHGAPLAGQVFNNYFRLNGLGQTSGFTSLNASIPTWAKWAAGIGGGAVITNQVLNHNKK